MGTFLSLSGIIGKTKTKVLTSLTNYANSVNGGLQQELLATEDDNCCVIAQAHGNTSILYPDGYLEWDKSSEFISKELKAPVFSFHIHDGDLWMYILYYDGQQVDQFNPVPDYWTDDMSEEEIESWKGSATTLAKYIPDVNEKKIENYLVRWDIEEKESPKAYPDDEFTKEEWQLIDFMKKLRLPYPADDNGNPNGDTYKLWTKELRLKHTSKSIIAKLPASKPWWKCW